MALPSAVNSINFQVASKNIETKNVGRKRPIHGGLPLSGLVEPHNWTTHTRHFPAPWHWACCSLSATKSASPLSKVCAVAASLWGDATGSGEHLFGQNEKAPASHQKVGFSVFFSWISATCGGLFLGPPYVEI